MANVGNPVMDVLNQGASRSSQSMSNAARTLGLAGQSFNRGASLALKIDQALENREARLNNQLVQAQKSMNDILNFQLNANFRDRQLRLDQAKFDANTKLAEERIGLQKEQLDISRDTFELQEKKYKTEQENKTKALGIIEKTLNPTGNTDVPSSLTTSGQDIKNNAEITKIDNAIKVYQDNMAKAPTAESKAYYQANIDKLTEEKAKLSSGELNANTSVVKKGSKSLTVPKKAQALRSEIERLKYAQSQANISSKGTGDALNPRIKALESELERTVADPAYVEEYASSEYVPGMTRTQFNKVISDKINNNTAFSAKDKSNLHKGSMEYFERKKKEYEEANKTYGKLSTMNNASADSEEYAINDAAFRLAAIDPALKEMVEAKKDKAAAGEYIMNDTIFDEYSGLADNETFAKDFNRILLSNPKLAKYGVTEEEIKKANITHGISDSDKLYNLLMKKLENNHDEISKLTGFTK